MILWLAASETAHAQTSSQISPQPSPAVPSNLGSIGGSQVSPGGTGLTKTPGSTSGISASSMATATGSASDPLNVPTANANQSNSSTGLPVAPTAGSAPGSTTGISASPSINSQQALQLPGEARNAATQAPNSTSSASSAPGLSSAVPCFASIPTTTGASSPGNLFGAGLGSGC